MNKEQFMKRRKIRVLSKKEQERRWRQHRAANRGVNQQMYGTRLRQRQTPKGKSVASLVLSPCAQDYLLALEAPFSAKQVACVPDLHAIPSKKLKIKTRGTFSTGLTGEGFITVCNWCNSRTGGAVFATESVYAGSGSILPPGTAGTTLTSQPKLPYIASDFEATNKTPGVQARTVGVGLRIRYIGPELARSGQITGIRHPDNENLNGLTFNAIKAYSTAKTFRNDRQWHYVMWKPVRPSEYHFSAEEATASDGVNYKYETGFILSGTTDTNGAPGPAQFEWELKRFVEYVGNIDNITPSHTDVVGMSHVRNASPVKSTTAQPHKRVADIIKHIEDHVGESLPAIGAGALAYKKFFGGEAAEAESSSGILDSIAATGENIFSSVGSSIAEFLPEGVTLAEVGEGALALAPIGL